jgi:transposase
MAAQTKAMHQIRQILELQQAQVGLRKIERLTGFSRNTVRDYVRRALATGRSIPDLLSLDDTILSGVLSGSQEPVPTLDPRWVDLERRLAVLSRELHKTGVTKLLLWQEYSRERPDGYSYTQFSLYLRRFLQQQNAVMHLRHSPGEVLMVDFAGDRLRWVDTQSGEEHLCEVLVCTFPFSSLTYVEALPSQKQGDFLRGISNALVYFGGVPQSIRCDNLRSAVTKSCRYEPVFTEAFELLCAHYQTSPAATRVAKPRDKASVENAVNKVYQRIYAPIRNEEFHSLPALNAAVRKQLDWHNTQLFQGRDYSRRDLFEQEEQASLRSLPVQSFQNQHVVLAKVQRNYHVILGEDRHQYSVPFGLIGKTLKVIYCATTVEVYHDLQRVAIHRRDRRAHTYTTIVDHMPANHRQWEARNGWKPDHFTDKARKIGPATLATIERILAAKSFFEQTYNTCLGIFKLADRFGNDRLEAACRYAQVVPRINYALLKNILTNNRDQAPSVQISDQPILTHDNLRGPSAYQ